MTSTFIDTIVICTMTGLSIVITGAWDMGLEGVAVTTEAFSQGPFMTVSAVWTIADIFHGLMALPNLVALIALSGVIVKETKDYFRRIK